MWKIVPVGIICLCLGACNTTNLSPAALWLSELLFGVVPPNGDTAARSASAEPTDLLAPRPHSPHKPTGFAPSHTYALETPPARKTSSANTRAGVAHRVVTSPLHPPAPREAAKPNESGPPPLKPEPKIKSPPGDTENGSTVIAPAAPEAKPEPVKVEPSQPEQPPDSGPDTIAEPPAPASSAEPGGESKTSIVPAPLFQ